MSAVQAQFEQAPAREVIRDQRGTIVGTIERLKLTGKLIARTKQGTLAGVYDPRSGETRDHRGRLIGQSNLLPVLLFGRR
ncbi:hypothetical protein SAMN05428997_10526 [Bosea sp. CRIB-10]|uniref:hypothetical protein n=1 Tax=Bosea sp. CRIB-10 TaxID=378404 RepID=UPI0008F22D1D|nr:hypothetical protein [Bosea sp. CRIB-10]SFC22592.1 hypothetical protein SAMN05428997_10526 [Bosea sp. CRIB-10]